MKCAVEACNGRNDRDVEAISEPHISSNER